MAEPLGGEFLDAVGGVRGARPSLLVPVEAIAVVVREAARSPSADGDPSTEANRGFSDFTPAVPHAEPSKKKMKVRRLARQDVASARDGTFTSWSELSHGGDRSN